MEDPHPVPEVDALQRLQAALRVSEAKFHTLAELTSDWYWEQDAQHRFTHISDSIPFDSRLEPSDYPGLTRWELPHAGVTQAQWARHRAMLDLHLTFHEFEMQRPTIDGGWLWISVSGVPIFDDSGEFKGYWGVGRDISDRKRAEQRLRESQNQYQELVEWAPVGLCVYQDGRIVYVNPAALGLWGASRPAELEGSLLSARIDPSHWPSALARIQSILETGQSVPVRESKYVRLDGRSMDVETQGMPFDFRGAAAVLISFYDITARKLTETTLRDSEDRFRILTQLSADWYWEQDKQHRFVMISGSVAASTGLQHSDFIGKTHWELPTLNVSETEWERHREVLAAQKEFRNLEIRWPDRQGRMHWSSVSGTPMFTKSGALRGYRGVGRDVTAQKHSAEQIHRLAFYDALTGLPNRRLLLEQLKKSLQLNVRHRLSGALLFIDLDNFKTLNDTLGHDVGDVLLQQVAERLGTCVRESDTVARLGGDEFVVVLDDLDGDMLDAASQAEAIGKKILVALNAPYQLFGREHRSSPSIGITLIGAGVQSVDDLLKQADLAMYQAKAHGRNTLRFFDVEMQLEVDSRAAMESDLRDGLQGGEELELHFQPMVDGDGQVTSAEALVRWRQPERGLVMPSDFIPLAETTGLILPLGRWVLHMACAQLATWAADPVLGKLTLAVNVSARQLREPDFVAQISSALQSAGATAQRLRLELTETVLVQNIADIVVKMAQLKALGVGFSLDDFGTGYSSLSYLKQLPLDLLKIDHSFVRDVLNDPNDAAIARTIVGLAHSLGLSVVAEGVETDAQRAFLASIGCACYQGFFFAEPMPIDDFNAFVANSIGRAGTTGSAPA